MSPNVMTSPAMAATPRNGASGFVGGICPAMLTLESVVTEIAATNIPVLLVGESGTGKQMFAQRIYSLSGRSSEPLLKVPCASINPETFAADIGLQTYNESGDLRESPGTAFFDEISELSPLCQRSLLYALPDGDGAPRRGVLTARLISATSRNLEDEMSAGRFRRELYYRINGVCLRLPPLRERKEDIPLLADFFLSKHASQFGRSPQSLSARALDSFMEYAWPGNIRELENVIKKIVALNDEDSAVSELLRMPKESAAAAGTTIGATHSHSLKVAAKAASREAEKELILKALGRTRWNRKRAAIDLQISYKSLLYKLKQIGSEDGESN